jgi:hypothetical protein
MVAVLPVTIAKSINEAVSRKRRCLAEGAGQGFAVRKLELGNTAGTISLRRPDASFPKIESSQG